ncbi:hypothetical protein C8Q76DRAFT_797186 [Earliella scabrosa]|nr:hypothetical protein C8Q76DRAFT_797186 [Earliella scabrosa]
MPEDLIVRTQVRHYDTGRDLDVLNFGRPLVPVDYARFVQYAPRVRSVNNRLLIGYQWIVQARCSPHVWNSLYAFRPMVYLLPNLRSVDFSWTNDGYDEQEGPLPLKLLLSSKLQHVDFSLISMTKDTRPMRMPASIVDALADYFSKLTGASADVRTFRVGFLGYKPPIRQHIVGAVAAMDKLTKVCLTDTVLPPEVLLHLAALPRLAIMRVCIHTDEWSEETRARLRSLGCTSFPTLSSLELSVDDADLCADLLKAIQSSQLGELSLDLREVNAAGVARCIAVLPHQPFAPQLRSVKLTAFLVRDPSSILYADSIEPLFALDLHYLWIYGCEVAVTDELLQAMSEAWRNIEELSFSSPGAQVYSHSVTLLGLLPLVYSCPALRKLSIQVDASVPALPHPIPELRPGLGKEQRALHNLSVGCGRITDAPFVAAVLADYFPECTAVKNSWPGWSGWGGDVPGRAYSDMWGAVSDLLKHFAKVRAQERHGRRVRGPVAGPEALRYAEMLRTDPSGAARLALDFARDSVSSR